MGSIYISCNGMDPNWIVGKIFKDVRNQFLLDGINCRFGSSDQYDGEEFCIHVGWAYAKPEKKAKKNILFITHIDDSLKEKHLLSLKNEFDSFITMSTDERNHLISIGFEEKKCFGIPLPIRNKFLKPLTFGIFSSRYNDGRKNEEWLINYFKNYPSLAKYVNFKFVGDNWQELVKKLRKINVSFEWHFTSRELMSEYEFQKNKLLDLNYYFYLGFDGGAMGTYDAYAFGVPLFVTDQSYHKDIPDIDYKFSDYHSFEKILTDIIKKHIRKVNFFEQSSIESYSDKIIKVILNDLNQEHIKYEPVTLKKNPISVNRFLSHFNRIFYKLFKTKL